MEQGQKYFDVVQISRQGVTPAKDFLRALKRSGIEEVNQFGGTVVLRNPDTNIHVGFGMHNHKVEYGPVQKKRILKRLGIPH